MHCLVQALLRPRASTWLVLGAIFVRSLGELQCWPVLSPLSKHEQFWQFQGSSLHRGYDKPQGRQLDVSDYGGRFETLLRKVRRVGWHLRPARPLQERVERFRLREILRETRCGRRHGLHGQENCRWTGNPRADGEIRPTLRVSQTEEVYAEAGKVQVSISEEEVFIDYFPMFVGSFLSLFISTLPMKFILEDCSNQIILHAWIIYLFCFPLFSCQIAVCFGRCDCLLRRTRSE